MLDRTDKTIIKELQEDGRQSYIEISRKLKIAESTVRRRVNRLIRSNIIRIIAVPDPIKLDLDFVCTLRLQTKKDTLHEVGKMLAKKPNVYYLSFTTGQFDIVAILLFHSSQELADFMWQEISTIPSVISSETEINMEIVKTPWLTILDIDELLNNKTKNSDIIDKRQARDTKNKKKLPK